jgi:hypothetical protein
MIVPIYAKVSSRQYAKAHPDPLLALLGDIGLSILLKMELIALPGNAWHDGFSHWVKLNI